MGLVSLGFWQLSRAEEKLSLQQQTEQKQAADAIDLNTDSAITIEQRFRNAELVGEYIEDKQVLVDNQIVAGRAGYYLITPFKLIDSKKIVLVNRGWLPVGNDRSILPEYQTPKGKLEISGRLNTFPAKPLMWKESYHVFANNVWQYLPIDQYQQQKQINVLPLLVELAPSLNNVGGYVREWRTVKSGWVNRHKAYAMQWFSLALAFLVCCLVVLIQSFSKKND